MGDFLNSKFMTDLKDGKLPAVVIDNSSILKLGGMFLVVGLVIVLAVGIVKKM